MIEYVERDGKVSFMVRVVPRASRSEVTGESEGALRVRLAAPPVEGAANEELIRVLARSLGLPRTAVEIVTGHSARFKRVRINGMSAADMSKLTA